VQRPPSHNESHKCKARTASGAHDCAIMHLHARSLQPADPLRNLERGLGNKTDFHRSTCLVAWERIPMSHATRTCTTVLCNQKPCVPRNDGTPQDAVKNRIVCHIRHRRGGEPPLPCSTQPRNLETRR